MVDAAAWTRSPVLQGTRVRLEPLEERHLPGLRVDATRGQVVGSTRYLAIVPAHRRLVARLAAHSRSAAAADASPDAVTQPAADAPSRADTAPRAR